MIGPGFASEVRDSFVAGDENAVVLNREAEQVGIGYLAMTVDLLAEWANRLGKSFVDWPELVAREGSHPVKKFHCTGKVDRPGSDSFIGGDAYEACLGEWTCGKLMTACGLEPTEIRFMELRVFACNADEDIDIWQVSGQNSSRTSLRMCSSVMVGPGSRSKTGNPSLYLIHDFGRAP